jgi:hypothetical protein
VADRSMCGIARCAVRKSYIERYSLVSSEILLAASTHLSRGWTSECIRSTFSIGRKRWRITVQYSILSRVSGHQILADWGKTYCSVIV